MKLVSILAFLALLTFGIIACGGESAEPENATAPSAGSGQATETPAEPTNTPVPEPTPVPADTPVPAAPQPTPTPPPEPTTTPEPTSAPEPTAAATTPPPTEEPKVEKPTATAPEPTATPTAAPEPTATPEPALPIANDMAPLGDNLLFVALFDGATQGWAVYDASGTFSPEQLPLPPGASAPDSGDIKSLTELVVGRIYNFVTREEQTTVLKGRSIIFYRGTNQLVWK